MRHCNHTRRSLRFLGLSFATVALTAVVASSPSSATAQQPAYPVQNRVAYRPAATYAAQPQPQPAQVQYAQPAANGYGYTQPAQGGGDPNGFLAWLNSTRAQYGLPAVGWDQNLCNWAAQNNAQQNARGMGHHVMGPARRQNSAMGSASSIGSMWMNSPAHRAALLDPTIRFIGLAGSGAYWTFNAY